MTATADATAPAAALADKPAVPAKAVGAAATSAPPPPAVDAKERESMRAFWAEHSSKPSVESMMLDSQAAEIDSEERPEVRERGIEGRRSLSRARRVEVCGTRARPPTPLSFPTRRGPTDGAHDAGVGAWMCGG